MSWQCEGDEVASVPLQVTISSFPEAREFRRRLLDAVLGVGAIEKEGQDCGSKMNALNQVCTEDTYMYIHSSRTLGFMVKFLSFAHAYYLALAG